MGDIVMQYQKNQKELKKTCGDTKHAKHTKTIVKKTLSNKD